LHLVGYLYDLHLQMTFTGHLLDTPVLVTQK